MICPAFLAAAATFLAAAGATSAPGTDVAAPSPGVEQTTTTSEQLAKGQKDERNWFALPALFWLPETKLGAAAVGGLHFRLRGASEASSAYLVAGFALEGQATVDLSTDLWLANGVDASARLRAAYYPEAFYGIGPETTVSQREDVVRRFLEGTFGAELPIPRTAGRLRAGPRLQARVEEIRDAAPGGLVATGAVPGAKGFNALALGASVTWDARDEKLWTTRGTFAQVAYAYAPDAIGRSAGFGRGSAEGRAFLPLGGGRVLGFAALVEQSHGETPFSVLAKIGSTRYLRGIREGRYRDEASWAAQTELRVPIERHFSAAAFLAAGDVAHRLWDVALRTTKVAGGAGIRYRLTAQGATLRGDIAVADAGPEIYVLLLEAF
jgi:outer membrane protein assembly factor BamA